VLRILSLHGYHGSAATLRRQLTPLSDGLTTAEFVTIDAPSIARGDFGWWHLNFRGWESTRDWMLDYVAEHGPFDGVLGFSQGAALTSLLVGLLPFDFAVMIGGFRSDSAKHADIYAGSYDRPSLHIMGRNDVVVPIEDSRLLAGQFKCPMVLEHGGGHVIPSDREIRAGFETFLGERCGGRT
jgi:pimeloyl-ACP methyl ester carboxylesterase